jgi:hypothetical protein
VPPFPVAPDLTEASKEVKNPFSPPLISRLLAKIDKSPASPSPSVLANICAPLLRLICSKGNCWLPILMLPALPIPSIEELICPLLDKTRFFVLMLISPELPVPIEKTRLEIILGKVIVSSLLTSASPKPSTVVVSVILRLISPLSAVPATPLTIWPPLIMLRFCA